MYKAIDLCNKLNEAHIMPPGYREGVDASEAIWTPEDSTIEHLMFLPQDNIAKIIEMDYSGMSVSYTELEQEWEDRGYLKFIPFVTDYYGHAPNLAIKYNRHLLLMSGLNFVVSVSPFERSDCRESGTFRTEFLVYHKSSVSELWSNSILANMLCYAAVIDTAFVFDNFRDWFNNHSEERDRFVKESFSGYGMDMQHTWSDMENYISQGGGWIVPLRQIYKVFIKDSLMCEFAFGTKTIQVRYAGSGKTNMITLKVPDAFEGIPNLDSGDSETLDEFRKKVTLTKMGGINDVRVDIFMLLIMVMGLSGFRFNWLTCCNTQKRGVLKGTDAPCVTVSNVRDLIRYLPDEF